MSIIFALLPFFVAIFLLLILQWNVCDAGWATLGVTVVLVSLVPLFRRTPWQIALSLGEGSATTLTTGLVLLPALLFSQMQWQTGAIDVLMRGLARFMPDRDLQTVFLVLGVGPCLEALYGSGFGAIIILPLLARLHHNKLKAVQLSLLSQLIAPQGSLGPGMTFATNFAGFPIGMLSIRMALLLFPGAIGLSIAALLLSGGRRALKHYWHIALLTGGILLLVTCFCHVFFMTEVAGVLAGVCVIAVLLIWSHLMRPDPAHFPCELTSVPDAAQFLRALFPYILLTTGIFGSRFFPPITLWLPTQSVPLYSTTRFPLVSLDSPGLWLLLAAIAHIPLFSLRRVHLIHIQMNTWQQFLPVIIAMVSFLSAATLMQDSGMIATLERTAMLSGVWIAPLVGAIGGWFTPGGNILTAQTHMEIGMHIGFPLPWLIAAQNISTAMASTVSPSRIVLLTTSVGLFGKEVLVWRKTGLMLLWSLVLTTLLLVWFSLSSWFAAMLVLLTLLIAVNAPIILLIARSSREWLNENAIASLSVSSFLLRARTSCFHHPGTRWIVNLLAYGSLLLMNVLYASYALVSLGPLERIDPVLFVCFQMILLAPIGLILLLRARKQLNRESVSRGLQSGGLLSTGLLCYTLALKNTGMTEAMVFSTLNGVVATFIAWKIFGQRISQMTRWACLFALIGAGLVWSASPARWQGDITSFVGGICLTGYAFSIERLLAEVQQGKRSVQPIMGMQFLTMALLTLVVALCFGRWQTLHFLVPSDLFALVYLSFATILLPCFLMLFTQRYMSAITVAFFSIIEPLAGAGFAFFSAGERLPMLAYVGGGIVLVGITLQMIAGTAKNDAVAPVTSGFAAPSINARKS